jgi:hypothetical protein
MQSRQQNQLLLLLLNTNPARLLYLVTQHCGQPVLLKKLLLRC